MFTVVCKVTTTSINRIDDYQSSRHNIPNTVILIHISLRFESSSSNQLLAQFFGLKRLNDVW